MLHTRYVIIDDLAEVLVPNEKTVLPALCEVNVRDVAKALSMRFDGTDGMKVNALIAQDDEVFLLFHRPELRPGEEGPKRAA